MRTLNCIDLLGQSIVLGVLGLVEVVAILTGQVDIIAALAVYAGLYLGPWQLVSSFLTTIAGRRFLKLRFVHLVTAIVYLVCLSIFSNVYETLTGLPKVLALGLAFGIPMLLAGFYYSITLRTFLSLETHKKLRYFFEDNFHNLLKI